MEGTEAAHHRGGQSLPSAAVPKKIPRKRGDGEGFRGDQSKLVSSKQVLERQLGDRQTDRGIEIER